MRLSDIKGDRVFDVIADIMEPLANIVNDENVQKILTRDTVPEGESATKFAMNKFLACVPKFLKEHKHNIIKILSAISEKSEEEYTATLNFASLIKDFKELFQDEAFQELFFSLKTEN